MANPEQVEILKQGVGNWNIWRLRNPLLTPDLEKADLAGENLVRANLRGANLVGANLKGSDLTQAHLVGADLSRANLENAQLSWAVFSGAKLTRANLKNANLLGASLNGARIDDAILIGADLTKASCYGASFKRAKLMGVNLTGTYLSNVNLNDCRLSGAVYQRANMDGKCKGIRVASSYGNSLFKRDAQDQDYIDTLREKVSESWWKRKIFRAWGWIDYGRSLGRVALAALSISAIFGGVYTLFPDMLEYRHWADWWFSPFYYSFVTYTTLGFGDITPITKEGMILVTIEVILGYITLGLLVSILANKVARRA